MSTTNGDDGPSFFARYIDDGRSPAAEKTTPPPTPLAALRLLDWLQHNWGRPTVCARDIYRSGPSPVRDRESALKSTEILEKRGWLIPLKSHRYDRKRWQITIGPA
jgi:hypothetical protein